MKHFFSKALSGTAKACLALALCMASPQVLQASPEAGHFEAGKGSFMLNGKLTQIPDIKLNTIY